MGSPGYMSPEQLRSTKDCDARTDIYGLGVVMYRAFTGFFPFESRDDAILLAHHLLTPAPSATFPVVEILEDIQVF